MLKYSLSKWKSWGVNVGLGTDTFPPDFIRNMHAGIMLSRVIDEDIMSCTAADYYHAATIGGANALGRSDLGRLYRGAKADITVFDLNGFHMGQLVDPIQTMVMNGNGTDVKTVIVNGRIVVEDRKLPGLCFEELQEKAQRQYDKLRSTYPERTHLHPPVDEIFRPSFPVVHRSGQAKVTAKP
jgi:cytosine/adenosine deaminase-related metal-dependent hydrolase